MKKVIVKEINDYNYTLVDKDNKTYIKNIEFYSDYKPNINDVIYLDESILLETNLFAFDEIYDLKDIDKKDVIKIINNEKEYYFQRRFG
jgi:hypothetical protein